MITDITFDKEFDRLYKSIPEEVLKLNGISKEYMDVGEMSHNYFTNNWNEGGKIDHNANSNKTCVVNYASEVVKPLMKLEGVYLLHRYLRKSMSSEKADRIIMSVLSGDMYVHDFSGTGIQMPYCFAFSTHWILENGTPFGQLPSTPPKHTRSFIGQVAEMVMTMSQQFAGATAPADVLVAYAHLAKKEHLTAKEIENDLQSLVHILNKEFRGGSQCVTEDTEVLTPCGFKKYDELLVGDDIYTWNDGHLNIQKVQRVNVYEHDGEMHRYSGTGVEQVVSPNHRVLYKKYNSDEYCLTESHKIINNKTPVNIPVAMLTDTREDYPISDDMLKMCVFILTDGSYRQKSSALRWYKSPRRWGAEEFENVCERLGFTYKTSTRPDGFDNGGNVVQYDIPSRYGECIREHIPCKSYVPEWMFNLSKRQANIVIDLWAKLDGHTTESGEQKLQCDNYDIADAIQHICFLAGHGSSIQERYIGNNRSPTIYVVPYKNKNKTASTMDTIEYNGKIWCPTTEDGVVVFRKNGKIFISGNSAYSNVSIFDRPGLEHLFGDMLYADGTGIDIDYVMFVQEVFMEWFSRGVPTTGEPYRFPVVTVNISTDDDGNILDDDFVKLVSKYNTPTGCFNIHSGESSKIASCPLHPDTEVLIDGHKGIQKSKIGNLGKSGKETYSVYINGEFKTGKFIRTKTDEWYKIVLSNGHSVITTPTHLNVTKRGTLKTHELVIGDKIPVSLQPLDEGVGSYNMGYLVGAYVGDGSRTERGGVTFSLNDTTKTHVQESLKQYMENELGSRVNIYNGNRGVVFVTTYSKTVAGIIDEYVVGNNALEKGLKNSVYNCSLEFRQGLYDGLYDTDGGNSHRIYTSSERMVSDISTLVSTLGSCTNINSVDTRDGRYSENPNYCVRTYQALDKRGQYGICERGDGVSWFDIVAIEPYECSHKYAYCFEMDTDEHLFQLANGIITHNCRLTQSLDDMRKYNQDSFGNGGLNIGSTHVVTINLPRIAVRTNYILSESVGEETNEDRKRTITSILERLMNDAALILDTHRNRILSKRIEQGFFPLIDVGLVDVDTMFSTFGFTGVPEFVEILGYDITSEEGIAIAGFVMDKMDELSLKISDEYGYAFNVEEVPAESASVTLRDLDVLKYGDDYAEFIGKEMYSNQFVPLTYDVPIIDRVTITGRLMAKATGGAIMHLNLDERITNESTMENLIRWVISKGVQHFAINYGFSRCVNGHSTPGIVEKCSDCSGEIEDYLTRIVGYFVPVKSWNKRRQLHDFPNRVAYYVNGDVE